MNKIFLAAVAAAVLVGLATSPAAQEAKKEPAAKRQMKNDQAAKGGDDAKRMRENAQADLAEVQAGKLAASRHPRTR